MDILCTLCYINMPWFVTQQCLHYHISCNASEYMMHVIIIAFFLQIITNVKATRAWTDAVLIKSIISNAVVSMVSKVNYANMKSLLALVTPACMVHVNWKVQMGEKIYLLNLILTDINQNTWYLFLTTISHLPRKG